MSNDLLKAKVVASSEQDPSMMGRIQVYIPSHHGEFNQSMVGNNSGDSGDTPNSKYPWASYIAGSSDSQPPAVGSIVIVGFQGNDSSSPIIIGVCSDSNAMSQDGGYAGGSLAEIAASIIFGNEGGYTSVNWKDVDAISIGKIQWHADNARNLLKEIRALNQSNFDSLASGTDLVSSLDNSWAKWCNWNSTCPSGKALLNILATNESKTVQDKQAVEYVQRYIDKIMENGVTDPKCVIYLADIANQGPAIAYSIAKWASSSGIKDLDALHNSVISGKPKVYGCINDTTPFLNRRKNTYSKIKEVESQGKLTPNGLPGMPGETGSGIIGWPAKGPITSYFYRSSGAFHGGIDIGVPVNTTIYSPITGTVFSLEQNGPMKGYDRIDDNLAGYGYYQIVVANAPINGVWYGVLMAHENCKGQVNNSIVQRGAAIGKSGNTGNSSGPHIHFEIRQLKDGTQSTANFFSGNKLDPVKYIEKL